MTIKALAIEQIDTLADRHVREVLDCIGDLKHREERAGWIDLMNAQQESLTPIWDNADDEVWNGL